MKAISKKQLAKFMHKTMDKGSSRVSTKWHVIQTFDTTIMGTSILVMIDECSIMLADCYYHT